MNASSIDSVTEGFSLLHSNSSHASGGPRVAEYSDDAKNEAAAFLVGKLFSERPSNKTGTWEAVQKSWSFVPNLLFLMDRMIASYFLFQILLSGIGSFDKHRGIYEAPC